MELDAAGVGVQAFACGGAQTGSKVTSSESSLPSICDGRGCVAGEPIGG